MPTKMTFIKMFPNSKAPVRAHPTDSGADFFCHGEMTPEGLKEGDVAIYPGETRMIATGIKVQVTTDQPDDQYNKPGGWTLGCFGWDKSGLSVKGLKIGAGCIDNSYTGEIIFVISYLPTRTLWMNLIHLLKTMTFVNLMGGPLESTVTPYVFKQGDKVSQLVVQRVELPIMEETPSFPETDRGEGGWGHTGT